MCGKRTLLDPINPQSFLIFDNKELLYCGASLKDAGRKVFAIGRIYDSEYLQGILSRI